MNKKIIQILSILFTIVIPFAAIGQNNNTKKDNNNKVVNVNKLDVIYHDEDQEYNDITIDQKEDERPAIPSTIAAPAEDDDDEELQNANQLYRPEQMGEGVDSEFDILYASMDYDVIHYASNEDLPNGVTIHLVDKEKGRKFCFPTPEHARLSSHFGARRRRWHYGVDLAQPTGEPIYAAFDGIVRISKRNRSYGNLVVVRHFNGLETYYAHLSQIDVNPGDTVRAGAVLGLCGNTGRSYGSHLHFEMRYMGKAMNPEYVVDCVNHKLHSDEITLTPAYFAKKGSSRQSPTPGEIARVNQGIGSADNSSATVADSQQRDPSKAKVTTESNPKSKAKQQSQGQAKYYKIRSGDTLSKIAARNGTTVKKLCKLNGIKETTVLQIGKKIRVK